MSIQTIKASIETVAEGFTFTESPRWHNGKLYFVDMAAHRVHTVDDEGKVETVAEFDDDEPSGLGFMPNGDLLIVGMHKQQLWRLGKNGLKLHADFSPLTQHGINDMVVDEEGRAYVVQFGSDIFNGADIVPSPLLVAEPDGRIGTQGEGLHVANGITITQNGRALITAESPANRIAVLDRDANGNLSNRRVFAQLPKGYLPDGICLDAQGGVWASLVSGPGVVRVEEGGSITHVVELAEGRYAYACMLGGTDRRTLYMCTSGKYDKNTMRTAKAGRIEKIRTQFIGAGLP